MKRIQLIRKLSYSSFKTGKRKGVKSAVSPWHSWGNGETGVWIRSACGFALKFLNNVHLFPVHLSVPCSFRLLVYEWLWGTNTKKSNNSRFVSEEATMPSSMKSQSPEALEAEASTSNPSEAERENTTQYTLVRMLLYRMIDRVAVAPPIWQSWGCIQQFPTINR